MSLDPRELRIGNLVNQGPLYGEMMVSGYELYQYSVYKNGGSTAEYYKDWQPIPLTEEWLIKAGFQKYGGGERPIYRLGKYVVYNDGKVTIEYDSGPSGGGYDVFTEINTVHQFQNLYYILEGEELTLKE